MIKQISVQDGRRGSRRLNFMIRAKLFAGDHPEMPGRVRDLSATGLKIELEASLDQPLKRGEAVQIELRGVGRIKGEIAWRRSGWYGIRFANAIDPEKAMRPVGQGKQTPDYVKPVVVPGRALKYVQGL